MRIELVEHGQMWPDYFQGTKGVQINAYVGHNPTLRDVVKAISDEINSCFENIEYIAEQNGFPIGKVESTMLNMLSDLERNNHDILDKSYFMDKDYHIEMEDIAPIIFSLEFKD